MKTSPRGSNKLFQGELVNCITRPDLPSWLFKKNHEIAKYRLRIGTFVSIFKGSQIVKPAESVVNR